MAKGPAPAKKGKAKAKASAAASSRHLPPAQASLQKIRENMMHLPEHCRFVKVCVKTGRTMPEQVKHDIEMKKAGATILFGKSYYRTLTTLYAAEDSFWTALKPDPTDTSAVSTKCLQAIYEQKRKHKYIYIYIYICIYF